jgi:hypothetical protein
MPDSRTQLLDEGYCVIPNVLSPLFIARLREATDILAEAMTQEEREVQRSTGSMIPVTRSEVCGELVGHADLHGALEVFGFSDWRFTSGYIISKPPHSPPLFWHFDWGGWDHPFSYGPIPVQLFVMVYLVDTSPQNGCLRVIPRSHIEEHRQHESMRRAHANELRTAADPSAVEFQSDPDEVDVAVKEGDLVVGDSRLIHSAHANDSDRRRTVITLWFFPNYGSLPEPIQGMVARLFADEPELTASWNHEVLRRFYDLRPVYEGTAEPLVFSRDRLSREAFFAKNRAQSSRQRKR